MANKILMSIPYLMILYMICITIRYENATVPLWHLPILVILIVLTVYVGISLLIDFAYELHKCDREKDKL